MKPIARVTAITHRNDPIFQCLLTGVPPQENHVLKQLPFEASFFKLMREQFPTIRKVAIPASGGVSFYMVIAMKERYGVRRAKPFSQRWGPTCAPSTSSSSTRTSTSTIPIRSNGRSHFRTQPARDVIVVDQLPAGPLDPSVSDDIPLDQRRGSALGIDATYPFGLIVKVAGKPAAHRSPSTAANSSKSPTCRLTRLRPARNQLQRIGTSHAEHRPRDQDQREHRSGPRCAHHERRHRRWQTPRRGDGAVGSTWRFIFDGRPEFAWRIDEAGPSRIAWTCTAGPGDSAGTEAVFTIATASDGKTHLLLGHTGWADTDGNFRKCNTIWGVLLHHLKQAVETGAPAPAFP